MKKGIHPENYRPVVFKDMSNDDVFITRSTITAHELINTSGCIDQLRLTGVERVRSVRDLDLYQRISYAVDLDRLFSVNSRTSDEYIIV